MFQEEYPAAVRTWVSKGDFNTQNGKKKKKKIKKSVGSKKVSKKVNKNSEKKIKTKQQLK